MLKHALVRAITTVSAAVGAVALATAMVVVAPAPVVGAADGAQSTPTLSPTSVDTDATPFALSVPGGVFCDGSGGDGWRMSTFIVGAGVNLSTLDFAGGFPPGSVGSDFDASDGSVMAPLYKGTDPGINFNPAAAPAGLVNPSDLSGYTFSLAEWNLVSGDYQIGFACTDATTDLRQWWSIPVTVDTAASPFMVVKAGDPGPEATTVALAADPASSTVGEPVTFTASVTPSGAAGNVEFRVGGVAQSTSAVAGGTATWTTSALTAGTKSVTAAFTPTSPAAFNGSTSSPVSFTVSPASAQATSLALTAAPASQAIQLQLVTLTANVTPSAAAGTVTFSADGETIDADVPVAAGVASTTTVFESIGSIPLSAAFTPADPAAFTGSTGTLAYAVVASPGDATTVTLGSDPSGQAAVGEAVTFTATVDPAVAGTVGFRDGGELLGDPVEVVDGVATYATSDLAEGEHEITAAFVPTDLEAHAPSVSAALALVVGTPSPTTTVPVPLPDGTDGFTDVAGAGIDSLPITGIGVSAAGVGLILVYVGRVLYLLGRPRLQALRR